MRLHRHPDGADGARPKHGALVRREYSILAPEEQAGDPAAAELEGSRTSPNDTSETGLRDRRGTGTRERNRQRALNA